MNRSSFENACLRNACGVLLWLAVAGPALANPAIYEKTLCSTGWVIVPRDKELAAGTCWLADKERKLVITSEHITGASQEVLVYFPYRVKGEVAVEAGYYLRNRSPAQGRVVAADDRRDLALIQLDTLPAGVEELHLSERSCRPGEDVHSIGNSGLAGDLFNGALWRYTRGNVRQVYRQKIPTANGAAKLRMVETQSPVNPGDSGGPVVNDRGQLVAVTEAFKADERLVSCAIDVEEVRSFLNAGIKALGKDAEVKTVHSQRFSPVGDWKFTVTREDGEIGEGVGSFRSNGTFVLSASQAKSSTMHRGRYNLVNGIMWLIYEDGQALWKLTWSNKDKFVYRANSTELLFEREELASTLRSAHDTGQTRR